MLALLRRIEAQGPPRSVELSHQVGSGLWELVRGRLRVLWFYDDDRDVILTHGFVKRSRKTPAAELHERRRTGRVTEGPRRLAT